MPPGRWWPQRPGKRWLQPSVRFGCPLSSKSARIFFPLLTSSPTLAFQGGGNGGFLPHLLHTITFTLLGSGLGVALGVSTGLAMVRSSFLRAAAELPIEPLRTIPPLAALPFILIWRGSGDPA
jgi:ABC-type nitrate/sulfonate/bicarbonate transport system permease component